MACRAYCVAAHIAKLRTHSEVGKPQGCGEDVFNIL